MRRSEGEPPYRRQKPTNKVETSHSRDGIDVTTAGDFSATLTAVPFASVEMTFIPKRADEEHPCKSVETTI